MMPLHVSVWDKNTLKDERMGTADVDLKAMQREGKTDKNKWTHQATVLWCCLADRCLQAGVLISDKNPEAQIRLKFEFAV